MDEVTLERILVRARQKAKALSHHECVELLSLQETHSLVRLFEVARAVRSENCFPGVAVRGLIEASNCCAKDCFYCGIRASNEQVKRYMLSMDEIFATAQASKALGFESLVLQSGEIESEAHTVWVEDVLRRLAPLHMGITLSLGEQTKEVYARWRQAGATRYLLRIETSNPLLYQRLHPASCSWSRRCQCLADLRATGYQVGTGVMCALPFQSLDDLANDIQFYGEQDVDMIGMGPYIPHPNTPLAAHDTHLSNEARLLLALKMIAVTRLYLHDVNIASSTALEALDPYGREKGLQAGANVMMPNMTDVNYQKGYCLYANKPCTDERAPQSTTHLEARLASVGETLLLHARGDSRHFAHRQTAPKGDCA